MATLSFHQFPYLSDNYGVLVHDPDSNETACIDAGDSAATLAALDEQGWKLDQIFVTHHHADHVGGLAELKAATGAAVVGPNRETSKQPIDGIDKQVGDGDDFAFGGQRVRVMHTPGHTLDMLNYYFPEQGVLFTGDTLFTMGCGRLFEGDAEMMWQSLKKISQLPAETIIYCSHEYTVTNGNFSTSVDPDNLELIARMSKVNELRKEGLPTVPSSLSEELATNPFLRASDAGIRKTLGMAEASDLEVFTELRKRRDNH